MSQLSNWRVPVAQQPRAEDYRFDLDHALQSVVALSVSVPEDAYSADTLGTERAGNGVVIREDGLVLTIGYLITEAEQVWITLPQGRVVPGHVVAYDQESGFGLVQPLARVVVPALPLGDSTTAEIGEKVIVGGAGGRARSVAARIVAKQEFAGYWEYVVDDAIFTAPAHPNWGGTALIGPEGELLGIGSLQLQQGSEDDSPHLNMTVPIDLLKPILEDLLALGRPAHPPRPWLGFYATEADERIIVAGVARQGPAERADLRRGDVVLAVSGTAVDDLAGLFRRIWASGQAGAEVPLTVERNGKAIEVRVRSADRSRLLRRPNLH